MEGGCTSRVEGCISSVGDSITSGVRVYVAMMRCTYVLDGVYMGSDEYRCGQMLFLKLLICDHPRPSSYRSEQGTVE